MAKKFLSGEIDFGILGKKPAYLFKNEKREKETQPAFRLFIRDGDEWREVGAFWVKEFRREVDAELIDL